MLFSRYGQGNSVLDMEFQEGLELVSYAFIKRTDEMLFNRWVTNYEREMSLQEFKQKLGICVNKTEDKKVEDILTDLKNVFG